MWRMMEAEPSGCMIWFDPSSEVVRLYRISPPSDSDSVPSGAPELDEGGESGYLDKVVSVSASEPGPARLTSPEFTQLDFLEEEDELPF